MVPLYIGTWAYQGNALVDDASHAYDLGFTIVEKQPKWRITCLTCPGIHSFLQVPVSLHSPSTHQHHPDSCWYCFLDISYLIAGKSCTLNVVRPQEMHV